MSAPDAAAPRWDLPSGYRRRINPGAFSRPTRTVTQRLHRNFPGQDISDSPVAAAPCLLSVQVFMTLMQKIHRLTDN
jgi:hypothetical protein